MIFLATGESENPKVPSLVFADEIAVQFGSEIVLNTFDQNRVFSA